MMSNLKDPPYSPIEALEFARGKLDGPLRVFCGDGVMEYYRACREMIPSSMQFTLDDVPWRMDSDLQPVIPYDEEQKAWRIEWLNAPNEVVKVYGSENGQLLAYVVKRP